LPQCEKKTPASRTALALTLALLTNPEVLAENQKSHQNRPLHADQGRCIWSARASGTTSVYYLALFSTEGKPVDIAFDLSRRHLGDKTVALRDLWTPRDLLAARGVIRQTIKPHGSVILRLSA
jgi:hypothetical protein